MKAVDRMKERFTKELDLWLSDIAVNLNLYYNDLHSDGELYNKVAKIMIDNVANNFLKVKYSTSPKKWFVKISGKFKCDAKNCDYVSNEGVKREHYFLWRNLPCPKCGANIFTDDDWITMLALNRIMGWFPIRFLNWIGEKFKLKTTKFICKMNGTGKLDIEEVKKEEDTK